MIQLQYIVPVVFAPKKQALYEDVGFKIHQLEVIMNYLEYKKKKKIKMSKITASQLTIKIGRNSMLCM